MVDSNELFHAYTKTDFLQLLFCCFFFVVVFLLSTLYRITDGNFTFIISILDIDECESLDSNNCDVNAMCTNTEGSYVCRCKRGYEGDGRFCIGNVN